MFNFLHKFLVSLNEKYGGGFLNSLPTDIRSLIYTKWLGLAGSKIGCNSIIHHNVIIKNPENIVIGNNVMVPASTDMAGMGNIIIGDDTLLGANIGFITNNHPLNDKTLSRKEVLRGTQKQIKIGRNCWIMNNVLIIAGKSGINIDDNVWIAAGSVVTKNVESNTLVGGVPAKFIKTLVDV